MFISAKRHEREKQELLAASNRLTEAILHHSDQGLFLLDAKDRIQPQVSRALGALFRRQDFANLSLEKLVAPLVTAKMLTVVRNHIAQVLGSGPRDNPQPGPVASAPAPGSGSGSGSTESAPPANPPQLESSLRLESSVRLESAMRIDSSARPDSNPSRISR